MAEKLIEQTAPSGSWATADAFGFSAHSVYIRNTGAYPIYVRWADSGDAVLYLAAAGSSGSERVLNYQQSTAPTSVACKGSGGAAAVVIEATEEKNRSAPPAVTPISTTGFLTSSAPAALAAAAAVGTASLAARGDHVHALPHGSTVAAALAAAAAAGSSDELSRVDHVHPLPVGSTVAAALAASASAGVATEVSRVDHVHPLPVGSTVAAALAASASAGVATEVSRVDHVHPLPVGTTTAAALTPTASAGVATEVSRVDHVHPLPIVATAKRVAVQSISASTLTPLAFDTETIDDAAMVDIGGANPERVVISSSSKRWRITASAILGAFTGGTSGCYLLITRNGSEVARVGEVGGAGAYGIGLHAEWVAVGDTSGVYYEAQVFHDDVGAINVIGDLTIQQI